MTDEDLARYRALKMIDADVAQAAAERRWRWFVSEAQQVTQGALIAGMLIGLAVYGPEIYALAAGWLSNV